MYDRIIHNGDGTFLVCRDPRVLDCGWSYDDAEQWLCQQAVRMLGEPDCTAD